MHSLQPTDQLQTSRAVCTFTYHCSSVTGTVRASCHNRAPALGTEGRLSYGHRWRTVHSCSMTEVEHWNVRCLKRWLSWCYNRSANYDWSSTHQIVLGTHMHENDEMANPAVYFVQLNPNFWSTIGSTRRHISPWKSYKRPLRELAERTRITRKTTPHLNVS